jgi:hypothetical protein
VFCFTNNVDVMTPCFRYRVKANGILVSNIHDKLGKESVNRGVFNSKWPRAFTRPKNSCEFYTFWDQHCLQSGKKWEDGFIEGLALSLVFVPFLCRSSVQKWQDAPASVANPHEWFSPKYVDNFLLECIVALELYERLSSKYDEGSLFACKRILPIFVDDHRCELSETAADATITKAEEILQRLNVLAQGSAIQRCVRQIGDCPCNAAQFCKDDRHAAVMFITETKSFLIPLFRD